jgi:cytochrome c oxidase subunit 2
MSDSGFHLLDAAASSIAGPVDRLFVTMLAICGVMAIVLMLLIVGFAIKYREGSDADRNHPPSNAGGLEAAWTAIPLAIFLGIFAWAAYLAVEARREPANALTIAVVGRQWMWKLQQPNGRQEVNELHLPMGRPVVLVMASQDVIHSFSVPAFRLKQDVLPGRYTRLSFTPTVLGDYRVFCTEYCGASHSAMLAHVVVMRPTDYAQWLESGPAVTTPAAQGEAIYRRMACASCHDAASTVHAPKLDGLFGSQVTLTDGRHVTADENYLRDAVMDPKREVVAGFDPIMPSYADQLDEEQLQSLIAYLKSRITP